MRKPNIFRDREEAEMMVYALENHFAKITALLDAADIPTVYPNPEDVQKQISFTVEQRVCVLIQMFESADCATEQNILYQDDLPEYLDRAVYSRDDSMEYDPEDLVALLALEHQKAGY